MLTNEYTNNKTTVKFVISIRYSYVNFMQYAQDIQSEVNQNWSIDSYLNVL